MTERKAKGYPKLEGARPDLAAACGVLHFILQIKKQYNAVSHLHLAWKKKQLIYVSFKLI